MTQNSMAKDRDGLWALIRSLKRFTLSDLHSRSLMNRSSISTYLIILMKAGYIDERKLDKKTPIYSLVKDNGIYRPDLTVDGQPKAPHGRQRMWMAMKALKRFNSRDLSLSASVGVLDAQYYCQWLRRANYLKVVIPTDRRNPEVFSFNRDMDTGLHAPIVKKYHKSMDAGELADRMHVVWDRNLGRIVYPESEAA